MSPQAPSFTMLGIAFAVGFVAFAVAESLWLLVYSAMGESSNWILEPTSGLIVSAVVVGGTLLLLSLLLLRRSSEAAKAGQRTGIPVAFFFGLVTSITICMNLVGLGNLWPIALTIDFVMAALFTTGVWFLALRVRRGMPPQ